jgi:hypothetical protein
MKNCTPLHPPIFAGRRPVSLRQMGEKGGNPQGGVCRESLSENPFANSRI